MLLALDTATHMAGLALYDEAQSWVLVEQMWYSADNHTVELMPRLVRAMEQQKISADDLTGLVVSLGPGSFTGLRIGLGIAKGLAMARDLPIVGVPTLEVVVRPLQVQRLPIWAILQAGRGRICAGYYVRRKGRWRRQGPLRLTTLDELCAEVKEPAVFCGEIDIQGRDLIHQRLGAEVTVATPAASPRRAAYLAELGWERLRRGDSDDAATLSPIYLHHPQIDG
jgi:tRNA threonylcarbamoyladenosine biosynthesis protein TsaB